MQKPSERYGFGRAVLILVAGSIVVLGQAQDSQRTNPNRTVGPQTDGSIVVSNNQTLTPAGKIVDLGSPVRAKALALNPNAKTNSGAVLLMGSPQPIIVFNTATGQVLQRFIPTTVKGTAIYFRQERDPSPASPIPPTARSCSSARTTIMSSSRM